MLSTLLLTATFASAIFASSQPADTQSEASELADEPAASDETVGEVAVPAQPVASEQPAISPTPAKDTFYRNGMTINLGVGMQSCRQHFCDNTLNFNEGKIGIGPLLNFDLGLRMKDYVDVTGGLTFAYLPIKDADKGDFVQAWYGLHAIARFYPIRHGRWDPYVGAGAGFNQFWSWASVTNVEKTYSFSRANVLLQAGLDVMVVPGFSIGPRFGYNITFGGRYCYWYEGQDKVCRKASSFADSMHAAGAGKDEQLMPRPWEFALMFKWRRK